MPTYASVSDVATRWARTPTTEESALITLRLADVERKIKKRIPDLAAKVTAATIDVEDVIQVEADTVLRLVRNPEGYLSETDGNYTYMLQSGNTAGALDISAEDWATLGIFGSGMSILVPNPVMPT